MALPRFARLGQAWLPAPRVVATLTVLVVLGSCAPSRDAEWRARLDEAEMRVRAAEARAARAEAALARLSGTSSTWANGSAGTSLTGGDTAIPPDPDAAGAGIPPAPFVDSAMPQSLPDPPDPPPTAPLARR